MPNGSCVSSAANLNRGLMFGFICLEIRPFLLHSVLSFLHDSRFMIPSVDSSFNRLQDLHLGLRQQPSILNMDVADYVDRCPAYAVSNSLIQFQPPIMSHLTLCFAVILRCPRRRLCYNLHVLRRLLWHVQILSRDPLLFYLTP